jgi:G3E family GTPase
MEKALRYLATDAAFYQLEGLHTLVTGELESRRAAQHADLEQQKTARDEQARKEAEAVRYRKQHDADVLATQIVLAVRGQMNLTRVSRFRCRGSPAEPFQMHSAEYESMTRDEEWAAMADRHEDLVWSTTKDVESLYAGIHALAEGFVDQRGPDTLLLMDKL